MDKPTQYYLSKLLIGSTVKRFDSRLEKQELQLQLNQLARLSFARNEGHLRASLLHRNSRLNLSVRTILQEYKCKHPPNKGRALVTRRQRTDLALTDLD
ncbi:unnamed protein product [Protopolystoma xenopodis]|uniref:Uncharacterized protein n=1 Tax=Protopolystoma xenopodis TaxID=117903 RepID=A0A3S5A3L1_9PLAT|nr:unnamed protein product [Protopolystoma xenopodis]